MLESREGRIERAPSRRSEGAPHCGGSIPRNGELPENQRCRGLASLSSAGPRRGGRPHSGRATYERGDPGRPRQRSVSMPPSSGAMTAVTHLQSPCPDTSPSKVIISSLIAPRGEQSRGGNMGMIGIEFRLRFRLFRSALRLHDVLMSTFLAVLMSQPPNCFAVMLWKRVHISSGIATSMS